MASAKVDVLLREGRDALRGLAQSDFTQLTDGEVLELNLAAQELQALATAVATKAMARLDTTRAWESDGARSPSHWVAWRCRRPMEAVRATAASGRALRSMPRTEEAFLAGSLTPEHVRVLANAQRKLPTAFERDERHLVALGLDLLFRSFQVAVRYWCDANDPHGAEADALDRYDARRAHCSRTFEGMVRVDADLDPIGGSVYARELQRLEQQLFEADWSAARDRLGDGATAQDLPRDAQQRRADAMIAMAKRSAGADGTSPRPLITVLLGARSLERICELSNGDVVTPGEVLPLLVDADVERVVFDGPDRVLDVGVRQRLFTGATRRAVEVRDRQCSHASCEVPAERCEVDHVIPYEAGGPTTQDNGDCKCRFHHRWHHRRDGRAALSRAA